MKPIKIKSWGEDSKIDIKVYKNDFLLNKKLSDHVDLESIETIEPSLRGDGTLDLFTFKIYSHIRIPSNVNIMFWKKEFKEYLIKALDQAIECLKKVKK